MLLIHGLGGSQWVWDRVVPLIEPVVHCFAIELESAASVERDADDGAARCYCLSAHSFLANKVAKLPESEIEAARRAESGDPHSAALLAAIAEVVANVAPSALTNYFNIVADRHRQRLF